MTTICTVSPAKLNLGLEVTGRRPDGFHDLVSIFQSVTLEDRLEFVSPVRKSSLRVRHDGRSASNLIPDNLVSKAIALVATHSGMSHPVAVALDKHIPLASGLGGASSNAATTLRSLDDLWGLDVPGQELATLATTLGSDVAFFLTGGTALVSGAGEGIEKMPPLRVGWFVVLAPRVRPIERKTATLYQALTQEDFTTGEAVRTQAANILSAKTLDSSLLVNPFQSHLVALRPEISPILDGFRYAGAPFVAMSGAGPVHYTYVETREEAERIAVRARSSLGGRADLFVATTSPSLPTLVKQAPLT